MKRLTILLLLIPMIAFAGGDKEDSNDKVEATSINPSELSNEELVAALEESNLLLEQAFQDIKNKQDRIEELEKEIETLKVELAAASSALRESNVVLEESYNQIASDQKEIEELREHIQKLIESGVEVRTPSWNVSFLAGYPAIAGTQISFNFPFLPQLGATTGALYSFEEQTPYITAGVKLNIDID